MTNNYIDISYHTLETRLKDCQRNADRMEECPNILATILVGDAKIPRQDTIKKKIS